MTVAAWERRAEATLGALPRAARTTLGLGFLVALSLLLRTRVLDASYWIDEGLSVGIASHPFTEIPKVLEQDGSPPLYYLLLHVWMSFFGTGEVATHALSLVFALAAVPVAYWAAATLFGRRAGWICAALAALNPFLTAYAQETRMYTLVALLSLVATAAFVHAFVLGERRFLPVLAIVLGLLLLTHNWALFFLVGLAAALCVALAGAPERRARLLDAGIVFGAAALVFAPWLPTLLFQARHTGAPWSRPPSPAGLLGAPSALLSGDGSAMALLLAGGAGLTHILRARERRDRRAVLVVLALATATLGAAWIASQVSPAWANRYFAIVLGPLLLLAAAGISRAGRLGAVALALVLVLWLAYRAPAEKSNVADVVAQVAPRLEPGDLVLTTHPEQIAVLHHYLPHGLRYATTLGPVGDPGVMDWRDALARLRAARPATQLAPLLDRLPVGRRLLLVRPLVRDDDGWEAPWTALVRERSAQWRRFVAADRRFVRVTAAGATAESSRGVRATLYRKACAAPHACKPRGAG